MLLTSAGGSRLPVIAQGVQADEGTVREDPSVQGLGLVCLAPRWGGGRLGTQP